MAKLRIYFGSLIFGIAALTAFGQPGQNKTAQKPAERSATTAEPIAPYADYHTHIKSTNASALNTDPLLPAIKLPDELDRLLRDKEKFGGANKDNAALADLYTKDLVVLNPVSPSLIRGERAVNYIIGDTVINRLVPTAYEVNGSEGFISGYEAIGEGASAQFVSIFLYVIRKGEDGKWRISAETFTANGPAIAKALTADELIKGLDAAGIKRGVVLSVAYWFGSQFRKPDPDEYAKVRAENDWVIEQVARYPDRLVAFCSFNPLKDYAIEEVNRCAKNPLVKGIKLHFGNSGVDLRGNPQHVEKVREVFKAINDKKLAIVVHLWTLDPDYETKGDEFSKVFLEKVLPAAPDITVQIAHLAGGGRSTDPALRVFADAIAAHDPRTRNLYFDVATSTQGQSDEGLKKDAERMRQIGMDRILYGTDMAVPPNQTAAESWKTFRSRMPLTEAELRTIAGNIAPFLREAAPR
jgi:predicted TIM-barrel fold metal-dependent hydrolase